MADTTLSKDTIPKSYAPSEIEADILARWEAANIGHCEANADGEPFSILIPPPNVTAALHVGHALNGTLQDLLTRWHRMKGFATLWMPGTDHAGIATQTVVEKRLMQLEGKKRTDFSRVEFVSRVQAWKDEYEATILGQLRSIGASCDWERTRFTMDEVCTCAVREAFLQLFRDGLIYRGKRLVNWDPVTLTALADDEVEMEEVAGHMYYLRYPLEDGSGVITVATTRPETMLGDTAVAINPKDPRAKSLKGKSVRLPIVDRIIPIVEDDFVVMKGTDDPKAEYATGFLKVTPAHDPNDWEIGKRHDLEVINVMATDATISDKYGWVDVGEEAKQFIGLSREDARKAIVDWFKQHELLESVRDYEHSVGHSYRSHVPIEPYLSDQWYVRVTDDRLRNEALRALSLEQYDGALKPRDTGAKDGDGELRLYPERYAQSYQVWHENLLDWCISRQLWWGHRIPVWSKTFAVDAEPSWPHTDSNAVASQVIFDESEEEIVVYLSISGGHESIEQDIEADGFVQDEDVLDTWFSSALWPLSTMGWPNPERFPETLGLLEKFNPTSVLCTAREIIGQWVSRMVMFNRYFKQGALPFFDVYIHPTVQDGFGQKMSKSLGNGVDPRDIIATHGADALRYSMVQLTTGTQDVRLGVDLICPYTGESFEPKYVTSHTGHKVMAPIQKCPTDSSKLMSTVYGLLIGEAADCEETPLAMNTSSRFDVGRNFANKFWNAARFALMNIATPKETVVAEDLKTVDHWMLSRVVDAIQRIDSNLGTYHFSVAADAMYDLLWRDFCDWYLEAIKPTVNESPEQQRVLLCVVDVISRLLHPICPFVTEAIWPHIQSLPSGQVVGIVMPANSLAATSAWPQVEELSLCNASIQSFEKIKELTTAIRTARSQQNVKLNKRIDLILPNAMYDLVKEHETVIAALASVGSIAKLDETSTGYAIQFDGETVLLANMLNEEEQIASHDRLQSEIESLSNTISGLQARLQNESYINNAPGHVVQESRDMLAKAELELAVAKEQMPQ